MRLSSLKSISLKIGVSNKKDQPGLVYGVFSVSRPTEAWHRQDLSLVPSKRPFSGAYIFSFLLAVCPHISADMTWLMYLHFFLKEDKDKKVEKFSWDSPIIPFS